METYDIVIIGAGPAGITSAIYASRAGLNYCLIEKGPIGGKVINAYEIENYPGFSKIEGPMLALNFRKQIKDLNINLKKEEVTLIDKMDDTFYINTNKEKYQSKYVIIATGTKENELKLPNEEALKGRGISFCATCDGAFFKDKDVVVYGGGDSALTEATFLAQIVKHLTIVSRHELRGETNNIKKLQAYNNVSYIPNTIITEVIGKDYLEAVKLLSSDNKEILSSKAFKPFFLLSLSKTFLYKLTALFNNSSSILLCFDKAFNSSIINFSTPTDKSINPPVQGKSSGITAFSIHLPLT